MAFLILCIYGCIFSCPVSGKTFIVKGGQPRADIVISDNPTRAAKLAALELQAYMEKITGARLDIAAAPGADISAHIYVGKSAYTDLLKITDEGLKYGAFRIVSGNDYLVLLGHDKDFSMPEHAPRSNEDWPRAIKAWDARTGEKWGMPLWILYKKYSPAVGVWDYDERGSLNAVYEFLRGLGTRWYMPGDLGEILPAMASVALPKIDKTVRPDFPYRDLGNYSPDFSGGSRDAILFRLRIGLDPTPELAGMVSWPHALNNVHGRDEVKNAHPEYFALYNGKRATDHGHAGAPCLSSEGLFQATLKYAHAVFDVYPDEPIIGIMPADGYVTMCQCDLCKGKGTPERGRNGSMSDYVWGFVNRIAEELNKTHPNKKVMSSAYGSYGLPPGKIQKFSPNLALFLDEERIGFTDPEKRRQALEIRNKYLEKLSPGNLYSSFYYLFSRPGCNTEGLPVYFPHSIAENLRSLKGVSQGEFIELSPGPSDMHAPGFNHLNVYVTARYYWDANQDVDKMLDEYYRLFYGPAAGDMKEFIEYSENNWPLMRTKIETVDNALTLLAAARKAAGDTVYGKRVDLVGDYIRPLHDLRSKLSVDRKDMPKWHRSQSCHKNDSGLIIDGQLDKPFWKDGPYGWRTYAKELSELETGRTPFSKTSFRVIWTERAMCVGILCSDRDMKALNITTTNNDDAAMFKGDFVDVLLETQGHSYYQVAVNPAGALYDADMKGGTNTAWSSSAKVAVYKGDNFWSVEMRIPFGDAIEEGVDPMKSVEGRAPSELYPWFSNICRQRARNSEIERSAWSPTGENNFCVPAKFGETF